VIAVLLVVLAAAFAVPCALGYWAAGQLVCAMAAVVATGLVVRVGWWLVFPGRGLPRNRVRIMRWRVRLGLWPGPGHATGVECWWRWGRFAAFRRSRRARPSLPVWRRYWRSSEHSLLVGRAYVMHGLRAPSEEHALIMAPPRTRKTGLLASMILAWPGPVVATSTKPDLFALTSGVRDRTGRPYVLNPQGIGAVPSTFGWDPVPGCEEPAVAIRRAEGYGLDIAGFLRERGSLYLVGRMQGEDAPLAPLFAALAGEIHYQGVLLASMQNGGRLDPPLLMALDEATQICPVPIPAWLADSGG
jgi:hypothetical protein